jgi:TolB-like protein/Tfp pilus assembly protein PilF
LSGPDIFISYNREDAAVAKLYADAFSDQSLDVWWDQTLRSGEAYDEVTEAALKAAKAVVVLWSPRSVGSRWVRAEATLADRNQTLVPARIEPCDLPIMFELTQTADLSHWQGDAGDLKWQAFLADVLRMVGASAKPRQQAPAPASAQKVRSRKPSIAVLPFINRSEVRADDIFAKDIVDDLAAALSTNRQVKVVAASATAGYLHAARDLRQIGLSLNVRYILEGNVRRLGENLRVTAQLVEAEDEKILWTGKFNCALDDLADMQEQLIEEVAAHLGVQVQRAEVEHALNNRGEITAGEAILRSDAHVLRGTRSGYAAAVAEAKRAVTIDPEYGAAYAVLAGAQSQLLRASGGADPQLAREVAENVREAHARDPTNPLVLCRIASAYRALGRPRDALTYDRRAVELNPHAEILKQSLASTLIVLGRPEEALDVLKDAEKLAPDSPWFHATLHIRAQAFLQLKQFDRAIDAVEKASCLRADHGVEITHTVCLAASGAIDRARYNLRQLRQVAPELTRERSLGMFRLQYGSGPGGAEYANSLDELWGELEGDEDAR